MTQFVNSCKNSKLAFLSSFALDILLLLFLLMDWTVARIKMMTSSTLGNQCTRWSICVLNLVPALKVKIDDVMISVRTVTGYLISNNHRRKS